MEEMGKKEDRAAAREARKQNKAEQIFGTIADVAGILMALFYIFYVTLLLVFQVGPSWLNYSMLGITVAYVLFFIIKIAALNRIFARKKKKLQRTVRLTVKYSKWGMKIINAAFVALTLTTSQLSDNSIIPMIGIMVVGFTFLISILWDVVWYIINRRLRDVRVGWDDLTQAQKKKRVDNFITSLVTSIDNFIGLDITESVSRSTERIAEQRRVTQEEEKPKQKLLKSGDEEEDF